VRRDRGGFVCEVHPTQRGDAAVSEWDIQVNGANEFTVRHNHDGEWVDADVEEDEGGARIARCPRDDRRQLLARDRGEDAATTGDGPT
jgi:hypothetical protein